MVFIYFSWLYNIIDEFTLMRYKKGVWDYGNRICKM